MNIRPPFDIRAGVLLILALAVALSGCGGGSGGGSGGVSSSGCSVLEQNQIILSIMQDIYLWNDRLPAIDPADYSSPEASG